MSGKDIFSGIITAMVTPFSGDKINYSDLAKIIDRQINAKINAIVIAGTTGEGTLLSRSEYKELLHFTVKYAGDAINVIAGCTEFSTLATLELVNIAQNLGAAGVMLSTPPYIKPNQRGLVAHYEFIHNNSNVPIILYSVPARCVVDFSDNSLLALDALDRIVALKDASSDASRPARLRDHGIAMTLLSGDDLTCLAYNISGGNGCISVASNVYPEFCVKFFSLYKEGRYTEVEELQLKMAELYELLFIETNPAPTKYFLSLMNLCSDQVRMPLTSLSDDNKKLLQQFILRHTDI